MEYRFGQSVCKKLLKQYTLLNNGKTKMYKSALLKGPSYVLHQKFTWVSKEKIPYSPGYLGSCFKN